jgi:hypothetical protein
VRLELPDEEQLRDIGVRDAAVEAAFARTRLHGKEGGRRIETSGVDDDVDLDGGAIDEAHTTPFDVADRGRELDQPCPDRPRKGI